MVKAENNLTAADISVICVYIVAVIAVGIWVSTICPIKMAAFVF